MVKINWLHCSPLDGGIVQVPWNVYDYLDVITFAQPLSVEQRAYDESMFIQEVLW